MFMGGVDGAGAVTLLLVGVHRISMSQNSTPFLFFPIISASVETMFIIFRC